MNRLSVACLLLFVALGACRRYDARVDCEETFACCDELGEPVDGFTLDECEADTDFFVDSLSSDERQLLNDLYRECRDRSSCDFYTCLTGETPTSCPAEFPKTTKK